MRKLICFAGFMLALATCRSYAFAADDGLVAWWKFDEGKGKAALDSTSRNEDSNRNPAIKIVIGKVCHQLAGLWNIERSGPVAK